MALHYDEVAARLNDYRSALHRELALLDAATAATPNDADPRLDLYERAGALAARLHVIAHFSSTVCRDLRSGQISDADAASTLASLLPG